MDDFLPLVRNYNNLTAPVVTVWKGLLERARQRKSTFNTRAKQVMSFYSGPTGAMWLPEYMNEFMGGPQSLASPKFKITSNVTFELVQIFRPLIFWEMPDRSVKPHHTNGRIDPAVLAGDNPEAQQYYGELAQQAAMIDQRNDVRSILLEDILNYCQREQPCGLTAHSNLALFDMLTKGIGFLKTEPYRFPFSDRTLVGSFYQNVDDVLVDSDCQDPLWTTARWVAIRHLTSVDETESHFGLPAGSLKPYATAASNSAAFMKGQGPDSKAGVSKDLIEWYEIFSKAGFGSSLTGKFYSPAIPPEFDRARGYSMVGGRPVKDTFAYLCICPQCPYLLNLTAEDITAEYDTPDEANAAIKAKTDWPTEYWRDNKWPIEPLWLYEHTGNSPWPMSGLSPAMGELTALNILMSSWVELCWKQRQQVIAVRKGAIEKLESLKNSDESVLFVELQPEMKEKIQEVIEFMKRPEVGGDLLKSIQYVTEMIKRRLGLLDELYGQTTGAEPRSAAAYEGKMNTVNIRPEYMQKQFAAFQSRVADKEVFCLYIHTSSQDISEQLGPLGMPAWDMLVTEESPESILRGSKCVVEAAGIRRPNKAKDMADLQGMQQYWLPIMASQLSQTQDVRQLNGYLKAIGEAGEVDVTEFLFPEMEPDQTNQAMQQAELERVQAETQKLSADAQKSMADAAAAGTQHQTAQQDAALKAEVAEHGMAVKQQTAEQAAALKERQAALAAEQKQEAHQQSLQQRREEALNKIGLEFMDRVHAAHQKAADHAQQRNILDQKASDDARRSAQIGFSKMLQSRAEHAMRMQQLSQQNGAR